MSRFCAHVVYSYRQQFKSEIFQSIRAFISSRSCRHISSCTCRHIVVDQHHTVRESEVVAIHASCAHGYDASTSYVHQKGLSSLLENRMYDSRNGTLEINPLAYLRANHLKAEGILPRGSTSFAGLLDRFNAPRFSFLLGLPFSAHQLRLTWRVTALLLQ